MSIHDPYARPSMRALVQQSARGPADLVLVTDQPRPEPGPDEYLIRVVAAGVNFADVMQTRGTYVGGPRPPYVAGFEGVGEIVAIGSAVRDPYPVGTHVIGTGPGAFAEYMVMPAATALPVPAGWPDAAALGLVLNGVTALAALRPLGDVRAGDVVLVHAAAGGVGQAAVRLARHFGARVVAVASRDKHPVLESLGAELILDRADPDLATTIQRAVGRVDVVLEATGQATLRSSLAVAKPFTGRVIVYGYASGEAQLTTRDLVFAHPVQIKGLHIGALAAEAPDVYRGVLDELAHLIALGVYPPGTPRLYPLADGPTVLEHLATGQTVGKVGLDPSR